MAILLAPLLGPLPSLREVAFWKRRPMFSKELLVTLGAH